MSAIKWLNCCLSIPMTTSRYAALIIDDDIDLCHLLVKVLAKNNIHAATAHTLHEAEHCMEEVNPKLILLDNNLPDGSGIDFMKKIKAFDDRIKVIMMTGDTAKNIKSRAEEEGIDSFLSKPFNFDVIRQQADSMLQLTDI